jgi:hypothetical protein
VARAARLACIALREADERSGTQYSAIIPQGGIALLHGCDFCGILSVIQPHSHERVQLSGDEVGCRLD